MIITTVPGAAPNALALLVVISATVEPYTLVARRLCRRVIINLNSYLLDSLLHVVDYALKGNCLKVQQHNCTK